MKKELYRAKEGRVLAGVCAGMAKYMNLSPTVVRWIFVAMVPFAFGGGLLLYIASIFLIPVEPGQAGLEEE